MHPSLLETFQFWQQSLGAQGNPQTALKNLRTALKLYALEGLGFKTRDMKTGAFEQFYTELLLKTLVKRVSKLQTTAADAQLMQAAGQLELFGVSDPAARFVESMLNVFDRQFDTAVALGTTSPQTKRNYRSVLGQYLKWLVTQVWWQELFPTQLPEMLPAVPRSLKPPKLGHQGSCYGLKDDQLPAALEAELAAFKEFRITGGKKAFKQRSRQERHLNQRRQAIRPQLACVKASSFEHKEKRLILLFLGWCVNVQGEALAAVSLSHLTDMERLQDYVDWLVQERQRTHCVGAQIVSIGIAVAKWQMYDHVQRRNWSDIPLIQELRELQSFFQEEYKQERATYLAEKWRTKELTHAQARQAVQYLRSLCASHRSVMSPQTGQRVKGKQRSDAVVVRAWQAYLIVKLLVYLPVRQQEIRQLQSGVTLLRELDEQGRSFYRALITDHKLKSKTGANREYKLPAVLTQDLDDWIQVYRAKAIQAVSNPDSWLAFWGNKPDSLEKLQQRLAAAKAGKFSSSIKSPPAYIQELEKKVRNLQQLIVARESAQKNIEAAQPLFFRFGDAGYRHKFGQPLEGKVLYALVRHAIATATQALFGQARWTNPHALRHIAAKHIRKIQGNKEALATLMGHSPQMSDAYADQILTDYEETQEFVDAWWEVG